MNINVIKANEKWSKHYDEVDDVKSKSSKKVSDVIIIIINVYLRDE